MYRFRDTLPIDISEQTISGDLVTIENPEEMGVVDALEVSLEPIQDLHGYDKPWSGGAGKNKAELVNSVNSYTEHGITWTVKDANTIHVQGTSTDSSYCVLAPSWVKVFHAQSLAVGTYRASIDNGSVLGRLGKGAGSSFVFSNINNGYTFSVTETDEYWIGLYVASGVTIDADVHVQIESGSTTTAWAPYSNICPISGWDSVQTSVSGKNMADMAADGKTPSISTGALVSYPQSTHSQMIKVNPSTAYVASFGNTLLNGVFQYDKDGNFIRVDQTTTTTKAVTTTSTTAFIMLRCDRNSTSDPTPNCQFEVGNTATAYEPYQADTHTTALPETVYGGTIDVVNGVLTVNRVMVDLGALTWRYDVSVPRFYSSDLQGTIKPSASASVSANSLCSSYPAEAFNWIYVADNDKGVAISTKGTVNIKDTSYTSASDFKTAMNGVQLVYELATPQTYQLTPQQIDLLLGTNHLWSDGEISVVWHKDLTKGRILPTEAVSINGQYIENVLDGYRTLYTKGRESLGAELNTYSVGTADGEKFKNKRYPARELTVGFQLIADTAEEFREKFTNLNNLLSLDEADFIFNDEQDKFFSGYPIMNAEVEAGENSVKGEWKIYCAYPFKRSVEPITLTMEDATVTNTTATFTIDYKGARPSRPVLRAKFAGAKSSGTSSEDGDCGFVAFMDGEENIVQLGNPDVLDLDEYASAETLINKEFVNVSDWTRTGGHTYKGTVTGSVSTSDTVDAFWNGGVGQTQSYAKPTYGSGTGLHGSILWKNTAGAVNFTLNAVHRLCVNNSNETGVFEVGAYNHSTGKMVAGFVIDKSANGTTGIVRYIVNGVQVGTDQIDLSYYNNHFGYCNRTPVYVQQTYYDPVKQTYRVQVKTKKKKKKKKYVTKSRTVWVARTRTVQNGWNYTQSNLNSSVQKDGSYVYIQVGNLPMRTFNVPDVEEMIAHDASVFMGTYGTALHTNMIHSLLFRRETGAVFAEQPNVFTAGDIVEADCNEATVYIYRDGSIGGHLEPQYGALGNDWEDFLLTSGTNVIRATWSDWVNPTYKPQIEIEYNEVFI